MKENWIYISSLIPGKDAENCKFKWLSIISNDRNKKYWSSIEDKLLIALVEYYIIYLI